MRFSFSQAFSSEDVDGPVVWQALAASLSRHSPIRGGRVNISGLDISPSLVAQLWWGLYESAERRFVQEYLKPDVATVELGASLGGISSIVATLLVPGTELICVEANPKLIGNLQRNIKLNGPTLRSEVIHGALGYHGDEVDFAVPGDHLGGTTQLMPHAMSADKERVKVRTIELGHISPSAPFQLLCDIEGAEVEFLKLDSGALRS